MFYCHFEDDPRKTEAWIKKKKKRIDQKEILNKVTIRSNNAMAQEKRQIKTVQL